tara:strand:+ start:3948 stop:4082 length:135 start_codon:yes stop_codon:yes gene_type:complete
LSDAGFPGITLVDGRVAVLAPLTFGRWRICRQDSFDAAGYDDAW